MKQLKNLRIWLIVVAFLITSGLLFGGQSLAFQFQVDKPVQREARAIKGVTNLVVRPEDNSLRIELKLRRVDDLQQVLDAVAREVVRYYNKPVTSITIADKRDAQLEQVRYHLSFYIQEALSSGHYIQLEEALNSLSGMKARVYFEPEFIFFQLEAGDHYLYEAIPRTGTPAVGNSQNAGGDYGR